LTPKKEWLQACKGGISAPSGELENTEDSSTASGQDHSLFSGKRLRAAVVPRLGFY